MKNQKLAICWLFFGGLLFGQTDINITATKTVDLPPEEVTFNVAVIADQDATLDQVLQAVKETGIAAKDLTGIGTQFYGPGPSQTRLAFQFALTVPFSRFKETLDKFGAVRRNLLANNSSMEVQTYFISVAATDAARDQARQRVIPELLEDARKKAEFVAASAGLSLGSIQGITDSFSSTAAPFFPGPFGPAVLKTTFALSVRFGIR